MEPRLDKLARQKAVKDFFSVIRGCDISSDRWLHSASVWWLITLALLFGGGCLMLPVIGSALVLAIVLLWCLNDYVILPLNFCLICFVKQRWYIRLLNVGIFFAYAALMCQARQYSFYDYLPLADLHFLFLMFVCQRFLSGWGWKIAKFTVACLVMAITCTIVWDRVIAENLYNCTDENAFGFLNPGDWVGAFGTFPVVQVDHITHVSQSMSDPDTIKKGWTVTDLWLVWLSFVTVSLIISIGLASLPWMPRRLRGDAPLCEN